MLRTIFTCIGALSAIGWVIVLIAEIVGSKRSYEYCMDLYCDCNRRLNKLEDKE